MIFGNGYHLSADYGFCTLRRSWNKKIMKIIFVTVAVLIALTVQKPVAAEEADTRVRRDGGGGGGGGGSKLY